MKTRHVVQSAKARALLALGKRTPLRLTHAITYRCNLRCSFCDVPETKTKEMDTEGITRAMRAFKKMGCIGWGFTGGEPLLRDDVIPLLQYAKECDFSTSLVTNATLTQKIALLERDFVDLIMLSLDGDKESTDNIRGKGTYDKVLLSLDIIKDKGIIACLGTAVDGFPVDRITHVLEIGRRFGASCSFQPVFDWQTGREEERLLRSPERLAQYRANVDYLIEQKRRGAPVWNSFGYLRFIRDYGSVKKMRCYAGLMYVLMDPEGMLHNCWWCGNKVSYERIEEAFAKLPPPPDQCYCFPWCHNEYSQVFSLSPHALFNVLKQL